MTPSEIDPALDLVSDLALELISTQKKLNIATEALEEIDASKAIAEVWVQSIATQALARIKEL